MAAAKTTILILHVAEQVDTCLDRINIAKSSIMRYKWLI